METWFASKSATKQLKFLKLVDSFLHGYLRAYWPWQVYIGRQIDMSGNSGVWKSTIIVFAKKSGKCSQIQNEVSMLEGSSIVLLVGLLVIVSFHWVVGPNGRKAKHSSRRTDVWLHDATLFFPFIFLNASPWALPVLTGNW